MNFSDIELAEMHIEALFVHDANGKLLRINEPEPTDPAPRFFLARTVEGNLWRTRYDLPDDLAAELSRLATAEPIVRDLHMPPQYEARYVELLAAHAPIREMDAGPSYTLPELDVPERAMLITAENAGLVDKYFGWLNSTPEAYAPIVAVIEDGAAVAVCYSSRLTARAGEAGVNTEAPYRGRGYAPDAVRGWAAGIQAAGKLPLYDTSWTNRASQAVARKVGGVQYAADFSIT